MTIRFEIPTIIETALKRQGCDPNDSAREALIVDLYRQGVLSHGQVAETLGIARTSVDALLTRHGVVEDLLSPSELQSDLSDLRRRMG